jgi:two-component system phosphate regulon sensor histidine kinase PhoR
MAAVSVNPILLKATSVPLPHGEVAVFIEDRQIVKTLAQARERWIADLAHELKTPLTSLQLIVETLQNRPDSPYGRWIDQMAKQINRLINLVQDFLDLTHLESSPSQYISPQEVVLDQLIQQVWQSLEPFAQKKSVDLVYSGESLKVWVDINRMTQVLINLFDNALKYSPEGGKIYVELSVDQRIIIDIYDEGDGFSPEDLPYVFDRLFRGDPSRQNYSDSSDGNYLTSMTRGSGLGLAIVRRIILAHGGEIIANNHPKTGGAWLQIQLPS